MGIVEVENICRSFGDTRALDGITFSVDEGEIFGLVGPDGSGKTTCLRILCGLMASTDGKAIVLGRDVTREPEAVKAEIGYMAQPAKLYDDLTVAENIHFYAELYHVPRDEYRQRMERLLQFSGLAPFTNRLFRNLSGGMKQKVGLTCALIHRPRVLFLDEPTNGVDPVSRREFWKILYELKREHVTMVVASTYLDEVERCHRVALFDHGRVRLVMEPPALKALMKGCLYKLTLRDRPRALKLLKSLPQVTNPSLFGAGIHLTLGNEAVLPAVKRALEGAGVGPWSVEPIQPSLEDVYLTLLAKER